MCLSVQKETTDSHTWRQK